MIDEMIEVKISKDEAAVLAEHYGTLVAGAFRTFDCGVMEHNFYCERLSEFCMHADLKPDDVIDEVIRSNPGIDSREGE